MTETPDSTPPSLESLLSGLDETARNAVMSEVRTARQDAAKYRTQLREAEPKLTEYEKLVESQKTEAQKAEEGRKSAEDRATKMVQRAVISEVKAAAKDFVDPDDAYRFLDTGTYVSDSGEIDVKAIETDLTAVLESKPHLKRGADPERRQPRPDFSASRGNDTPAADDPAAQLQAFFAQQLGRN